MALSQQFDNARGGLYQSPLTGQSLSEMFQGNDDPNQKLLAFVDNTYIRALMSGEDNQVIAGIRVNLAGRRDSDGLSASARFVRNMMDQMMVDAAIESLGDIRERMDALEEQMDDMALEDFGPEARMLDGETRKEWIERMNKKYEEGLEDGSISQERYEEWMRTQDEWQELDQKAKIIEARLRQEYQQQQAILAELGEERSGLLEVKADIQRIKAMDDPAQQDAAIAVLVANNPDIDFDSNDDGVVDLAEVEEVEQVVDEQLQQVNVGIVEAQENIHKIDEAGVDNLDMDGVQQTDANLEAALGLFGEDVATVDAPENTSEAIETKVQPLGIGLPT